MSLNKAFFIFVAFIGLINCAATTEKRSFGEIIDDKVITLNLKTKFIKDKNVPSKDITIKVWKGTVTLKGEITEQEHINRAIEITEQQRGVKEVKAFLVLKEFGELREDHKPRRKKPFFKSLFGSGNKNESVTDNKTKLQEKDLSDNVSGGVGTPTQSVSLPSMARTETEPTTPMMDENQQDDDNLDNEEDF